MAGDIYVSFGADTGDLEAAFALAKAQTNGLAAEMRALAVEMASTGAAADFGLAGRLTAVGAQFAAAKAQTAGLKDELRGVGASGGSRAGRAACADYGDQRGFERLCRIVRRGVCDREDSRIHFRRWANWRTDRADVEDPRPDHRTSRRTAIRLRRDRNGFGAISTK